jgi:hypothetical protein
VNGFITLTSGYLVKQLRWRILLWKTPDFLVLRFIVDFQNATRQNVNLQNATRQNVDFQIVTIKISPSHINVP